MINFYGGQPGKDFRLAKIFNNRQEALADLNQGIVSNIGVGDFVLISYGDIGSEEYINNFEKDKPLEEGALHKSYNGCFYVKDYIADPEENDNENDIINGGWVYRFISRFTGPIPIFDSDVNVSISTEDISKPNISIDSTNPDIPIMNIELPNPTATMQAIEDQQGIKVELKKVSDSNIADGLDFNFTYPKPAVNLNKVDSTIEPSVEINDNTFTFNFTLPKGVSFNQISELKIEEGINGDLYINTTNGQVYQFINNEYKFLWDLVPIIEQTIGAFDSNIKLEYNLTEEDGGYKLMFTTPATATFDIEVTTLPPNKTASAELKKEETGYKISLGIPQGMQGIQGDKGDPMIIWDKHNPFKLSGSLLELNEIELAILDYLNNTTFETLPSTSGELLPITYIYSVDAPNTISTNENSEDLSEYGIDSYEETEVSEEELSGIKSVIELASENTYLISEKTILGFFGYYTNKWNIFLAPNGGGAGNIEWEIL